jgi:hypothetical protein
MIQTAPSSSNEPESSSTSLPASLGERFYYEGVGELIREWQLSGTEESFWVYLGMSEGIYKSWVQSIKQKKFDA